MKIGLVGLGRMGSAICGRLMQQGCEVTAWDRDTDAMQASIDSEMVKYQRIIQDAKIGVQEQK